MGFFSWKTADTNEAIRNIHSNGGAQVVFMLSPNGNVPYEELAYDGFGIFGGKDAYEHVYDMNMTDEYVDADRKRSIGLALDMGEVSRDVKTGKLYSFHYSDLLDEIEPFVGNYGTIQPDYGLTPNELHDKGIWEQIPLRDMIIDSEVYYPLKFSFTEGAIYEELEASKNDPNQGFFDEH